MPEPIIDVNTGKIHFASGDAISRAAALVSCIAVVAFDVGKKIVAMAYIMPSGILPTDSAKKICIECY